ncbi:MFS transporter [Rickettsia endosymbiont of Cardiosporidium cionae]|uniref:MFS transporter n=1 Tax=Rickettsia endosymbiont of Cardiosporidium cionae TaxID=2777155 RepID=UPI00189535C6|nr:MFS transporter [Rickettsia endosymbiont of Cardiosporidium cionae]KAF8818364.1 MFS transporter [Rickettsia endosymbiont of Cardiosporidium cionae]
MFKKNSALSSVLIASVVIIFYCYQYIFRVLPNVIMPDIIAKYLINSTDFGFFAGIYYLAYVLVHIPIGVLLMKFGSKYLLPISILLTAIGGIPMSISDSWCFVLFGRAMTGIGSSAAAVCALQLFRILYPNHFSRMLGVMVFCGLLVAIYGSFYISVLTNSFGIVYSMNVIVIFGILLSIATYILLARSSSVSKEVSILKGIKIILGNYKVIIASIVAGLMVGPLEGFADAWGSVFLVNIYNLDKIVADDAISYILYGMCFGGLLLPYIADKYNLYLYLTLLAAFVMFICFMYLLSCSVSVSYINKLLFVVGVFSAYQVLIVPKISSYVSTEQSGLAASIANMFIMGFGGIFHNGIGNILDLMWSGVSAENGTRIYKSKELLTSISIIPLAILVAFIILLFITDIRYKLSNFLAFVVNRCKFFAK